VINSPLVDRAGDRLGRVKDLIVRLGGGGYPPISGVLGSVGGRDVFVPIDIVARIEPGSVRLPGERLSLQQFQRRPGEVLLAQDLAGRHVMNLVGARLARANEIELARVDGHWVVAGVDPGSRPVLRRLLPRPLRQRVRARGILDWSSVEPFVGHVPTARLRIPYRKLARLKPAQIADLVEEASHEEGEEIIEAVGGDSELEADVFEELDDEHQLEFLASRSDTEAAALLGNMAPDDAADLLIQLDQDRRLRPRDGRDHGRRCSRASPARGVATRGGYGAGRLRRLAEGPSCGSEEGVAELLDEGSEGEGRKEG
jgi:hypothetical protein